MWKSLFGWDNDDSKLVNQPTIDYNITSTRTTKQNRNNNIKTIPKTYGTVIDYTSDDDDEAENELDRDIRYNTNMINEWSSNMKPINENLTLPNEYPGKFPNRPHSAPTITKTEPIRNYKIDKKLEALQRKIDAEIESDKNSNIVQNINKLHSRILQQTSVLSNLNDLVDIYQDNEEMLNFSNDEKYNQLKKDYLVELNRVLKLYEAYYLLFNRYLELKRLNKKNNKGKTIAVPVKEKLKLIKSKTTDVSIKNICENVINDVKKMEIDFENQKNQLIEKHDLEVEELKKRIEELESGLK